jgi:hypothetical protein
MRDQLSRRDHELHRGVRRSPAGRVQLRRVRPRVRGRRLVRLGRVHLPDRLSAVQRDLRQPQVRSRQLRRLRDGVPERVGVPRWRVYV